VICLSDIQRTVANIQSIAERLKSERIESPEKQVLFLRELRECTVGLNLLKHLEELDGRTLSALYIVKILINDFWRNLAGDATFGFDEVMDDAAGFSKNLGRFVYLTLMTSGREDKKAMNALFECITLYYSCLSHMRKKNEEVFSSIKK